MYKQLLGPLRQTNLLGLVVESIGTFRPNEVRLGWDWYDHRTESREVTLVLYLLRWEIAFTIVLRYPQPLDMFKKEESHVQYTP